MAEKHEEKHDAEKDKAAAAEAFNANLETFLEKFKSITPEQQIALNNLRDSIDKLKTAQSKPAA